MNTHPEFDEQLRRFEERLPHSLSRIIRWLRQPSARMVRVPAGIILIVFGAIGFLPLVGFWMIPLGLLLIAHDVPLLRNPMARLLAWIERKWPPRGKRDGQE